MSQTRRQLIQIILANLSSGEPSQDFPITEDTVNLWLNGAIAAAAMKSYTDNAADGYDYISDGFYGRFTDLPLTLDNNSGLYNATLPQLPAGVPVGWDVSVAQIKHTDPDSLAVTLSLPLMRITRQRIGYYNRLPRPHNAVCFYFDNVLVSIDSPVVLNPAQDKLNVTCITAGETDMDSVLRIGEEQLGYITDYLRKNLMPEALTVPDTSDNGRNIPIR